MTSYASETLPDVLAPEHLGFHRRRWHGRFMRSRSSDESLVLVNLYGGEPPIAAVADPSLVKSTRGRSDVRVEGDWHGDPAARIEIENSVPLVRSVVYARASATGG